LSSIIGIANNNRLGSDPSKDFHLLAFDILIIRALLLNKYKKKWRRKSSFLFSDMTNPDAKAGLQRAIDQTC
jgi:hypothetical protein